MPGIPWTFGLRGNFAELIHFKTQATEFMRAKKNSYQKELDHKVNRDGLTEYNEEILPNPNYGPHITDDMYGELDSLEFFTTKKLLQYRNKMKTAMKNYSADYEKIEAGLSSYAKSAIKLSQELAILKHSLLAAYDNILLERHSNADEAAQQAINTNYFESFAKLNKVSVHQSDLISEEGLDHYRKKANQLSKEAFYEWLPFIIKKYPDNPQVSHFEELNIYRGVNYSDYYQKRQNAPDTLSVYTGLNGGEYFERTLFTPYSLSHDVAQKFQVDSIKRLGRRKLFIEGHPEMIDGRILSSFIVSPSFHDGQFEILCLPNQYALIIRWLINNEIMGHMTLSRESDQ